MVITGNGEFIRIAELGYCPMALDYGQEEYITECWMDYQNGGLGIPLAELPEWLYEGIAECAKWERNKESNK